MALVPFRKRSELYDPFGELEVLQNEMNRLFNTRLTGQPERETGLLESVWSPAIDIYDSKDNIMIRADLPGMKKEDIDVSVHQNLLTIKGEKKQESEEKQEGWIRSERFYGSFNRTISLNSDVDADKVKASYQNGVLELALPKKEEARPKQVNIEVK